MTGADRPEHPAHPGPAHPRPEHPRPAHPERPAPKPGLRLPPLPEALRHTPLAQLPHALAPFRHRQRPAEVPPTGDGSRLARVSVVDIAIYRDGVRVDTPTSLEDTFESREAHGGFAWLVLDDPSDAELDALRAEFSLDGLAIEDAREGHQRPKLERYDDMLFLVLRPSRYHDAVEQVEFGELHLFLGRTFAIAVRRGAVVDLAAVRQRLEGDPVLLRQGPAAVLYAVLDEVVDRFEPVVAGLENDIDEIEEQLFSGDPAVTRRIYDLAAEVMGFERATKPLLGIFPVLDGIGAAVGVSPEIRRDFRDVQDHVLKLVERGEGFRQLLQNALSVHATLVAQRQNDEMQRLTETSIVQAEQSKKIAAWAGIFFAPSLIGSIYGMNFRFMPELDRPWGYPAALVLMAALGVGLYVAFKRRKWL